MVSAQDKPDGYRISVNTGLKGSLYIMVAVYPGVDDPVEAYGRMYRAALSELKKSGASVFHERIFGSLRYYDLVSEERKRASSEADFPDSAAFTYIEGNPVFGEGISGFHIQAFTDGTGSIRDFSYDGRVIGKIYETSDALYYMLSGVHGRENDGQGSYGQTVRMFDKVNGALKKNGLGFANVLRTWIYLRDILSQYDEFNAGRTKVFTEYGLLSGDGSARPEEVYLPASTGIGGMNIHGAYGCMDVLAVKAKEGGRLRVVHDTGVKQKSAFRYGSAFSRSVLIENEDCKKLYLSGTASIDESGKTVFTEDIEKQIVKTGEVIEALLSEHNMTMENMVEGSIFLKNPGYIDAFNAYMASKGWEGLPFIVVIADICRSDLLFEIDASFCLGK